MAFALVQSGGKQHRVEVGERIRVEKLDVDPGQEIALDRVLAAVDEDGQAHFGAPLLDDCTVTASVVSHGKGAKIRMIKFRRRKNSRRRMGHRQQFTELEILSLNLAGVGAKPAKKAEKQADKQVDKQNKAAPAEDDGGSSDGT